IGPNLPKSAPQRAHRSICQTHLVGVRGDRSLQLRTFFSRPCARCHSSSDWSGYSSHFWSPALASTGTQSALESSRICTCSGALGSLLSMALANGWMSSGQRGSQTHSALPHLLQKLRSPGLFLPSILAWNLVMAFLPRTFRLLALAPRL